MTRETKLLHLRQPAIVGDRIDGWRVFLGGKWKGERVIVVRTAAGAEHTNRPHKEEALPGPPPTSLAVQGYWSAVRQPEGIS